MNEWDKKTRSIHPENEVPVNIKQTKLLSTHLNLVKLTAIYFESQVLRGGSCAPIAAQQTEQLTETTAFQLNIHFSAAVKTKRPLTAL